MVTVQAGVRLLLQKDQTGRFDMKLQQLLSYTRRAVDDYDMIEDNDKIAVGISGGKDSLTLLCALKYLQGFYPRHFQLMAITVHTGHEGFDLEPVLCLCRKLEVPYTVIPTEIAAIVFEEKKSSNPCSLCAKLRKGAFNRAALEHGCTKIAYAHHQDDIIETMLLSLIYEGRFHTFLPKTFLDRTGLTLIRPLIYVPEARIKGFQNRYQLPVVHNPCPADGVTKRQYVKELLCTLNKENPGVKERMFRAIVNAGFGEPHQMGHGMAGLKNETADEI